MKDPLGDRMKTYERVTQNVIPIRTNTIVRIDGRSFSNYTKKLEKPFDLGFTFDMTQVAIELCKSVQGVKLAYVQSDEISLILTDYDNINTTSFFGGNVQKITSVTSGIATAKFIKERIKRVREIGLPHFDSRVFTLPQKVEVYNYFLWRQQDCIRNTILGLGQCHFKGKLHGMETYQILEELENMGISWEKTLPDFFRLGRFIVKERYYKGDALRTRWIPKVKNIKDNKDFILNLLPVNHG